MIEFQNLRLNLFKILLVIIFIIYSARLFSMQILSGETYRTRAEEFSRRTYKIPTQRGEIYDRFYTEPMVINRDSFALNITPAEVPRNKMDEIMAVISEITGIPGDELKTKLPSQYFQLYQPVELASNVSFATIAALAERKNELPGVTWQSKFVRNYIDVQSLSHVLGYVGDITREELTQLYNLGYQQGDVIGKMGIEKQYDEILRGKDGWETRTVDVRGRRVNALNTSGRDSVFRQPPEMGKNLVLTIDSKLQKLVESALGPRIGSAVVLKPATGEILAMVSYPWYDPNIFTEGLIGDYRALLDDPNKPFVNRAISSSYPPASTWKILMTTAVLAERAFPPEQTVLCTGSMNFGNRDWHCHYKWGHGRLNLRQGLAQSCNIYYWTMGRDHLGAEKIINYSHNFGFGQLTGVDLPGEISGVIPTPVWKERRFHERWVAGDTMNMSIGQGFTNVTPIQLANMTAMVVNDGIIYKPHVLKEVRDPVSGAIEQFVTPEILHQSDISPSVFEAVRQNMRAVITEGTVQYVMNLRSIQVAGKTGTGEAGYTDRWHSWFTAYAPYDSENLDDTIVVSVIIEAANKWEWWAPFASAMIFHGYFNNQDYDETVRALGYQYLMPVVERVE